jgi:hypothetical protein
MDHYELPMYYSIGNSKELLNSFFQAKYGLFTCYDSVHHNGRVNYDPELIEYWERKRKYVIQRLNLNNIEVVSSLGTWQWPMQFLTKVSHGRI